MNGREWIKSYRYSNSLTCLQQVSESQSPTTGIFVAASPGSTRLSHRRMKRRLSSNCCCSGSFLHKNIACLRLSTMRCTCPNSIRTLLLSRGYLGVIIACRFTVSVLLRSCAVLAAHHVRTTAACPMFFAHSIACQSCRLEGLIWHSRCLVAKIKIPKLSHQKRILHVWSIECRWNKKRIA